VLRLRVERVLELPHRGVSFLDSSNLEEGGDTMYLWLLASRFSKDEARALEERFDRRYSAAETRTLARDLLFPVPG